MEDHKALKLFEFFLWFRENGEKYVCHPIEHMIQIYLNEKYNSEIKND